MGGLAERFAPAASALATNETRIVAELNAVQGEAVDIGGYYRPDAGKTARAMRPCDLLNGIIADIS